MKDSFSKLSESFKNLKTKALGLSKQTKSTAKNVKGAVEIGLETSKAAYEKGREFVEKVATKENLDRGLDVTSKGADLIAKGAKVAARSADTIADTMEKASDAIKKNRKL